jgi:dihydroxyacetone kinase-like predicted kinase
MTLQFLERNPGTTLEALHNEKTHKGFVDLTIDPKIVATVPSAQYVDIYKENFNIQNTINTENTGNPSVQDFLEAIKKTKSSRVLLIVDDSNYILAAKETLELLPNNVKVELFAAGNIANSYIACLAFNDRDTYSENTRAVGKKVKSAKVCRVSKAVKDVKYSHISVKKNDYIGIIDKKIITSGKNLLDVTESLIKTFVRKGKYKHSFIFYGDNTTINDAETLKKSLKQTYLINSDIIDGGQKNYFFTIAFEV